MAISKEVVPLGKVSESYHEAYSINRASRHWSQKTHETLVGS